MFGFDSVTARKAQLEVGAIIRRLLDKSTCRSPSAVEETRLTRRCKRVFPVFVLPWADGSPDYRSALFATTTELSDYGIGLILSLPLQDPELVVGILVERKPCLIRGQLKRRRSIGGGFWHIGVQTLEVIEPTTA